MNKGRPNLYLLSIVFRSNERPLMQPRKLAPVYTFRTYPSVSGRALSLQYPTYVEPFSGIAGPPL